MPATVNNNSDRSTMEPWRVFAGVFRAADVLTATLSEKQLRRLTENLMKAARKADDADEAKIVDQLAQGILHNVNLGRFAHHAMALELLDQLVGEDQSAAELGDFSEESAARNTKLLREMEKAGLVVHYVAPGYVVDPDEPEMTVEEIMDAEGREPNPNDRVPVTYWSLTERGAFPFKSEH